MSSERDLAAAEGELVWRFASAAAAIGFAAQAYNFDEPRTELPDIDSKLLRRMWDHKGACRKAARIDATLAMVDADDRAVLREAYTPHGWPEFLHGKVGRLDLPGARFAVCVAGLVGRSAIARRAHLVASAKRPTLVLLDFLEERAREKNGQGLLRSVRDELRGILDAALERYAAMRPARETRAADDGMAPVSLEVFR